MKYKIEFEGECIFEGDFLITEKENIALCLWNENAGPEQEGEFLELNFRKENIKITKIEE